MQKSFDEWNVEKKTLERINEETIPFHEREIWWCSIGINLLNKLSHCQTNKWPDLKPLSYVALIRFDIPIPGRIVKRQFGLL